MPMILKVAQQNLSKKVQGINLDFGQWNFCGGRTFRREGDTNLCVFNLLQGMKFFFLAYHYTIEVEDVVSFFINSEVLSLSASSNKNFNHNIFLEN